MPLVRSEDRGSIRHLVLNRPEKRNALNAETILELGAAIEAAAADDDVRVLLLRGEGAMFSSGMDLHDLRELAENPGNLRAFRRPLLSLVESARGDAQADDLPDPRRGARRRVRAGAGLRLPHDGPRRDGRDHGGARRAAAGRGRLLAPARHRRPRQRQGADHDRQGHRRDRGAPDRLRQSRGRGRGPRRGRPRRSPTSCWLCAPRAVGLAKRVLDAAAKPALALTLEQEVAAQEALAASEDFAEGTRAFFEKRHAAVRRPLNARRAPSFDGARLTGWDSYSGEPMCRIPVPASYMGDTGSGRLLNPCRDPDRRGAATSSRPRGRPPTPGRSRSRRRAGRRAPGRRPRRCRSPDWLMPVAQPGD